MILEVTKTLENERHVMILFLGGSFYEKKGECNRYEQYDTWVLGIKLVDHPIPKLLT